MNFNCVKVRSVDVLYLYIHNSIKKVVGSSSESDWKQWIKEAIPQSIACRPVQDFHILNRLIIIFH